MENSSLQKTPASEDGGEALSSYWLMKSEPDSRLEKGVDVKVQPRTRSTVHTGRHETHHLLLSAEEQEGGVE